MAKRFHELSPKTQTAVFALLAVTTVGAAWQVLIGPARAELATRQARLTAVTADVAKATATARRLPALEREVAGLEQSLIESTAVLPDEKDAQDVLRQHVAQAVGGIAEQLQGMMIDKPRRNIVRRGGQNAA